MSPEFWKTQLGGLIKFVLYCIVLYCIVLINFCSLVPVKRKKPMEGSINDHNYCILVVISRQLNVFYSFSPLWSCDLPFISLIALIKSLGSLKLRKPYPLLLFVFLSRTTFAFRKDGYFEKFLVKISSVTSLPRSPQNTRKSSEIKEESANNDLQLLFHSKTK